MWQPILPGRLVACNHGWLSDLQMVLTLCCALQPLLPVPWTAGKIFQVALCPHQEPSRVSNAAGKSQQHSVHDKGWVASQMMYP